MAGQHMRPQLETIPEELLHNILQRLSKPDLGNLCLASRWGYQHGAPLIWRELDLVDCRSGYQADNFRDEHDDGPLIKKLLLLVTKPWLASHVQIVTHRCHLPAPAIFDELPTQTFAGRTLSCDPRTILLVKMAAQNMNRVHTLRIILGHATLTDALIRCFFDASRKRSGFTTIRKLWLESCRINVGCSTSVRPHPHRLPVEADFSGLESVRFRRLPIMTAGSTTEIAASKVYSRNWNLQQEHTLYQDGMGGTYCTSLDSVHRESHSSASQQGSLPLDMTSIFVRPYILDEQIYTEISKGFHIPHHIFNIESFSREANGLPYSNYYGDSCPLPNSELDQHPSPSAAASLFSSCSATLTSLNLDWIMTKLPPSPRDIAYGNLGNDQFSLFLQIFDLRFPHLKAFQVRNCVVGSTSLPTGLFLFDVPSPQRSLNAHTDALAPLRFLEAHQKLECLAWPMDRFYSDHPVSDFSTDLLARVNNVEENLGRSLLDLRVDFVHTGLGERQVARIDHNDPGSRLRRRRFIQDFCPKMTKLTSIKIEGGIARDERRETLSALRRCPLTKIVLIGVCSPLGNTWGGDGSDVDHLLIGGTPNVWGLEPEHKETIFALGLKSPSAVCPPPTAPFHASYGWDPAPPFLHTIASLHASTVTELKFCGYKGSPILYHPTPITTPFLFALSYFHKLESLILSMWLPTHFFDGGFRDHEIIGYWLDAASPGSTALVVVNNDDDPEEGDDGGGGGGGEPTISWARTLSTTYAPEAMAKGIVNDLGPFLSPRAKVGKEGVHVRASFCVGDHGAIFDIDLRIGMQGGRDVCLGFEGPRTEMEKGRREGKLEGRRWF